MNVVEWLVVVVASLAIAVFLWAAVMSVIDQRRAAERHKRWLQEMLGDSEEP